MEHYCCLPSLGNSKTRYALCSRDHTKVICVHAKHLSFEQVVIPAQQLCSSGNHLATTLHSSAHLKTQEPFMPHSKGAPTYDGGDDVDDVLLTATSSIADEPNACAYNRGLFMVHCWLASQPRPPSTSLSRETFPMPGHYIKSSFNTPSGKCRWERLTFFASVVSVLVARLTETWTFL